MPPRAYGISQPSYEPWIDSYAVFYFRIYILELILFSQRVTLRTSQLFCNVSLEALERCNEPLKNFFICQIDA